MHLRCWTCLSIPLTFTTTTLHRTQKHDHKNLHINHPSLHPKRKTDMYQHIHMRTLTMQHKLIQTPTYQVRTARTCTQRHAHVHAMIKMWVRKRERAVHDQVCFWAMMMTIRTLHIQSSLCLYVSSITTWIIDFVTTPNTTIHRHQHTKQYEIG